MEQPIASAARAFALFKHFNIWPARKHTESETIRPRSEIAADVHTNLIQTGTWMWCSSPPCARAPAGRCGTPPGRRRWLDHLPTRCTCTSASSSWSSSWTWWLLGWGRPGCLVNSWARLRAPCSTALSTPRASCHLTGRPRRRRRRCDVATVATSAAGRMRWHAQVTKESGRAEPFIACPGGEQWQGGGRRSCRRGHRPSESLHVLSSLPRSRRVRLGQ